MYEGDISFLESHPLIQKITQFGSSVGIELDDINHSQDLLKLLLEHQVKINSFDANDIALNEIFVKLAGSAPKEEFNFDKL